MGGESGNVTVVVVPTWVLATAFVIAVYGLAVSLWTLFWETVR